MKYIDGAQRCNIAECDVEHWGWSNMPLDIILFSFYFYINDIGRVAHLGIFEMLTKRNKNIILVVGSEPY